MKTATLLAGAGIGAALTFILDPDRGHRRRALIADKVTRAGRRTRGGLDATARDIANRARGIAAAAQSRLRHEDVDDSTLVARVRSKLGRTCSHPHALAVEAHDGEVTVRGPILAHEVANVLAAAEAVPGVRQLNNQLEPHETGEGIPALQGDRFVSGPRMDLLQRRWAPATRALVTGCALATGTYLAARARRTARGATAADVSVGFAVPDPGVVVELEAGELLPAR